MFTHRGSHRPSRSSYRFDYESAFLSLRYRRSVLRIKIIIVPTCVLVSPPPLSHLHINLLLLSGVLDLNEEEANGHASTYRGYLSQVPALFPFPAYAIKTHVWNFVPGFVPFSRGRHARNASQEPRCTHASSCCVIQYIRVRCVGSGIVHRFRRRDVFIKTRLLISRARVQLFTHRCARAMPCFLSLFRRNSSTARQGN